MSVVESRRTRHLIIKLDRGDDTEPARGSCERAPRFARFFDAAEPAQDMRTVEEEALL